MAVKPLTPHQASVLQLMVAPGAVAGTTDQMGVARELLVMGLATRTFRYFADGTAEVITVNEAGKRALRAHLAWKATTIES